MVAGIFCILEFIDFRIYASYSKIN